MEMYVWMAALVAVGLTMAAMCGWAGERTGRQWLSQVGNATAVVVFVVLAVATCGRPNSACDDDPAQCVREP